MLVRVLKQNQYWLLTSVFDQQSEQFTDFNDILFVQMMQNVAEIQQDP